MITEIPDFMIIDSWQKLIIWLIILTSFCLALTEYGRDVIWKAFKLSIRTFVYAVIYPTGIAVMIGATIFAFLFCWRILGAIF